MIKCFIFILLELFDIFPAQKEPNLDEDWNFIRTFRKMQKQISTIALVNIFSKSGAAENTAIDQKFVDKDWRKLNLPHDWAVELPFVKSENEI